MSVLPIRVNSSQTLDLTGTLYEFDASKGSIVGTLITAKEQTNSVYHFVRIDNALLNSVTVRAASGETIDGNTSFSLTTVGGVGAGNKAAIYGSNTETNWRTMV